MVDVGGVRRRGAEEAARRREHILCVRGLTKTYLMGETEVQALRGVNLDVRPGEMVAVVGASGAGKTTLLHLVGALDRPTSGDVLLRGERLFQRTDVELAHFRNRSLGFVFQFHHLLPEFSGLENVMMPGLLGGDSRRETRKRARELLERLGLGQRQHHRPAEMSGGEQQRIAIARALLNRPALVLADEPTGNLDSATAESIFELLREINQTNGQTFLIATHNGAMAERMDRMVVMVDGTIAATR